VERWKAKESRDIKAEPPPPLPPPPLPMGESATRFVNLCAPEKETDPSDGRMERISERIDKEITGKNQVDEACRKLAEKVCELLDIKNPRHSVGRLEKGQRAPYGARKSKSTRNEVIYLESTSTASNRDHKTLRLSQDKKR